MPTKKRDKQLTDEKIYNHKRVLGILIAVIFGILGISALMIGAFSTQYLLVKRAVLVFSGIVPMTIAPFIYRKINKANPNKGVMLIILTIETAIEKEIITRFSMIYNLTFGVVKIILGIYTGSLFFAISAVSSFCFGLGKREYIKGMSVSDNKNKNEYYLRIALLIMTCGLSYGIYMSRFFFINNAVNYGKPIGIGIATMAFTEFFFQ